MAAASMPNVPQDLAIRVLYSDNDVVVIDKPCDLRSVPGHADPPPPGNDRPRGANAAGEGSQRRTAQEAWVKAIQTISGADNGGATTGGDGDTSTVEEAAARELLSNLGTTANPSCVPRKFETFVKYCSRNSKRLLPSFPELHDRSNSVPKKGQLGPDRKKQKCDKSQHEHAGNASSLIRTIAQQSYAKIQEKQRPLMNLPKPTDDRESAVGQLRMLGFGDYSHSVSPRTTNGSSGKDHCNNDESKLYIVHRLDCQTSGIMVVARNQAAASILCKKWRERESVKKIYLANVVDWPPYRLQNLREGNIEIPLAASRTERIKWEVRPLDDGGKECKTFWRVLETTTDSYATKSTASEEGVTLELHPITGRTHQLRIHCAVVGSGIVGDSLYGDNPIVWSGDRKSKPTANMGQEKDAQPTSTAALSQTLRLHAHKLTFPHPTTGSEMNFESPKPW